MCNLRVFLEIPSLAAVWLMFPPVWLRAASTWSRSA
jgi:hypothetical protein